MELEFQRKPDLAGSFGMRLTLVDRALERLHRTLEHKIGHRQAYGYETELLEKFYNLELLLLHEYGEFLAKKAE